MPRLTQEEAKKVIKQYFSDAMRCLEQQMDVVDDYSGFLASVSATPSLIDFTDDRKRLDFLYPNEFYDNKGEPALGIEDNHTPDAPRIISFLANKHHIDAPQGTYSYEVLKTGVQRAIAELLNIHGQYVNYDTDIQIADDMFKEASSSLKVIENNGDPISEIFEKYLNECKRNDEGTHSLDSKRS
ncbi:MAG: hypothetical protein VX196_06350, partial [Pseudomonadota bacterium]|nr:hypothetical protein [Pseudomonadota bacterium]